MRVSHRLTGMKKITMLLIRYENNEENDKKQKGLIRKR